MIKYYNPNHIEEVSDLKKRYITDAQGNTAEINKVYQGSNLVWTNSDYYGVKINHSTGEVQRIGRMEWHATLPIQSKMKRCLVSDGGSTIRYVSDDDYTKDTEGNTIDYTAAGHDIMVEIPEHYFEAYSETENGVQFDYIKLYPYAHKGQKVPKHYNGAVKASINRNTNKVWSVVKSNIVYNANGEVDASDITYALDAATFRGGDGSSGNDNNYKTLLGKPVTNITIENMANYSAGRGNGYAMLHWAARSTLVRLYVVEYASLDSQAEFTDILTVEGYHQGGLGTGVSNFEGSAWSAYNSYYPLIPCGITLSLGNHSGVVKYNLGQAVGSVTSTNVPSYRGVESPFGDIWELCNGIYIYNTNNINYIFTKDDGWSASSFVYDSSTTPVSGFSLKNNTLASREGWITDWTWGADGDFVPSNNTNAASNTDDTLSQMKDYSWGNNSGAKRLVVGGAALSGVRAGLFAFYCVDAVSYAYVFYGSRLLYIPQI